MGQFVEQDPRPLIAVRIAMQPDSHEHPDNWAMPQREFVRRNPYHGHMKDLRAANELDSPGSDSGFVLHVSDRTTAAMQLATYFTAESVRFSTTSDPRERLAEQLSYFDLAFRTIMSSTARTMIKASTNELDQEPRSRTSTNEFKAS